MTKQYCDFCGEEQKPITTITFDREAGEIESCDECVVRLKALARTQAWKRVPATDLGWTPGVIDPVYRSGS